MKKNIYIFISSLLLLVGGGCRKFLTQHPNTDILDDEAYSSTAGIFSILNGLYTQLSSNSLYGNNMTMTVTDVMAQYYNSPPVPYSYFSDGGYTDVSAHAISDLIWDSAYNTILQANVFMNRVKGVNNTSILDANTKNLLLGEAYAIRGFLEFDLLRLYGPVYSLDSTASSIVYNYSSVQVLNNFLPAKTIIGNVWNDLDTAIGLLQNDPVINIGVDSIKSDVLNPTLAETFFQRRNLRLNYYAVKALQARVALYRGNKMEAGNIAIQLINELSGKGFFNWSPDNNSLVGSLNFDPLFSSEIIFAVFNANIYSRYLAQFAPSNSSSTILKPNQIGLNRFYEDQVDNPTDFRLRSQWSIDPSQITKDYTFSKYKQPATTTSYEFMQPLIRISEIYYIAAEATNNFEYLNSVREHRGLSSSLNESTSNLQAELEKEYRKEFWGEGQLFFYYKRTNQTLIPTTQSATSTTNYSTSSYVLVMPVIETINH